MCVSRLKVIGSFVVPRTFQRFLEIKAEIVKRWLTSFDVECINRCLTVIIIQNCMNPLFPVIVRYLDHEKKAHCWPHMLVLSRVCKRGNQSTINRLLLRLANLWHMCTSQIRLYRYLEGFKIEILLRVPSVSQIFRTKASRSSHENLGNFHWKFTIE